MANHTPPPYGATKPCKADSIVTNPHPIARTPRVGVCDGVCDSDGRSHRVSVTCSGLLACSFSFRWRLAMVRLKYCIQYVLNSVSM